MICPIGTAPQRIYGQPHDASRCLQLPLRLHACFERVAPHGLTPLVVPSAMCGWSHQEVDAAEDQNDPEPAHDCISQVGTKQGGQVHSGLPHLQLQGGVRGAAGGGRRGTQRGDQGWGYGFASAAGGVSGALLRSMQQRWHPWCVTVNCWRCELRTQGVR